MASVERNTLMATFCCLRQIRGHPRRVDECRCLEAPRESYKWRPLAQSGGASKDAAAKHTASSPNCILSLTARAVHRTLSWTWIGCWPSLDLSMCKPASR
jgi:hypothetical protein